MERVETTILRSLAFNEDYSRKVLPFIRTEYFTDYTEKVVFEEICNFIFKYNKLPTNEILLVEIENRTDLNENTYKELVEYVKNQLGADVVSMWRRHLLAYLTHNGVQDTLKLKKSQDYLRNFSEIKIKSISILFFNF